MNNILLPVYINNNYTPRNKIILDMVATKTKLVYVKK